MMSTHPPGSVSVIICCYTEQRLSDIREAVASVQAQSRPPEEIILAVDNNPALYQQMAAEYSGQVNVVLNDTFRGLSTTRNTAIVAARGDLIAFLDDDAVAEPAWLANLVALFHDRRVVAAGGQAILNWVNDRPNWFPEDIDWVVGGSHVGYPLDQRTEVQNPHGHNMCFRKEVFATTGMFDCSVGRVGKGGQAGEEAEFCLRLKRDFPGSKIVYEPLAVIHHKVPPARGQWKYLTIRSFQEGACKSRIQQYARSYADRPFHRENAYLRQMLFKAVPSRLARFWRPAALAQATAIVVCVAATGFGYLAGRWKLRNADRTEQQLA